MKMNKFMSVLAAGALAMSMAACKTAEKPEETAAPEATAEAQTETVADNSNKAAIVGSWQLSKVLVSETEGEDPVEVQEADHASMFSEKENVYTFNEDGTGTLLVVAGPDQAETELSWVTDPEGTYTVTGSDEETFIYDPVDDVLMREYIGNDPYIHVVSVFGRK